MIAKVGVADDPTGPRLASLAAVARALSGAQTLEQVLNLVTREAMFAFDADTAAIGRVERDRGLLRLLAWAGAVTVEPRVGVSAGVWAHTGEDTISRAASSRR